VTLLSKSLVHSVALLAALKENDQFREQTFALPDVIRLIFDNDMFNRATNLDKVNFMEMLVQHQLGSNKDKMLDHFSDDLKLLSGNKVWSQSDSGKKGIIKIILENYYNQKDKNFDHSALSQESGGIRIDLDKIGSASGIKSLKGWADIKEKVLRDTQFIWDPKGAYAFSSAQDMFDSIQVLTIAGSADRLDFTGSDKVDVIDGAESNGITAYGGAGNDLLIGSKKGKSKLFGDDGNDVLIAGDGGAELTGGAGSDKLFAANSKPDVLDGGEGKDIYYAGAGDTIVETGKDSEIYLGAQKTRLVGGLPVPGKKDIWRSADGAFTWVRTAPDTFLVRGGAAGTILTI
jgi:hypothetical protein